MPSRTRRTHGNDREGRPIELGSFELTRGNDEAISGQTTGREDADGLARTWWLRSGDEILLCLADVAWENGARDVRVLDRGHSPQRYDRLVQGVRLGVQSHGDDRVCELPLRQNRIKPGDWSNLYKASLAELSTGAGLDVREALLDAGALEVGTRWEVLVDDGRRRAESCVLFHAGELRVPAVAYALTRVLPLYNGVTADG